MLSRRDFLKRMGAAGLVLAAPKIIFDYGANSYKQYLEFVDWKWINPERPEDPFRRVGYYYAEVIIDGRTEAFKTSRCLTVDKDKALEVLPKELSKSDLLELPRAIEVPGGYPITL